MIDNDTYCIDVITQTSALRGAVSSLEDKLLENHLSCCVADQVKKGQTKKIQEEVLKVYKLAKKNSMKKEQQLFQCKECGLKYKLKSLQKV